ncbi:MAG TPA: hypothetical protein VMJ14_12130 [Burkholderiales bacterium]|nr:hypothetical protein [Burkholderiales bacterium]
MKKELLFAVLCLTWTLAGAADFDGSKSLICATMEAHDCDAGETCTRVLPDNLGLPQFIRIDFAKQAIVGPKRTTPIKSMERSPDQVLLQGTELGFAWTLAIESATGRLNASFVNAENAVAVFGACTPQ